MISLYRYISCFFLYGLSYCFALVIIVHTDIFFFFDNARDISTLTLWVYKTVEHQHTQVLYATSICLIENMHN